MPKFEHHFLPLAPPVAGEELPRVKKLEEANYITKCGHTLKVCLLGRSHTIDVISVSIPEGAPQDRRGKWIREIMEHMLTVLRLCYMPNVDVIRVSADGWINLMNQTDGEDPKYPAEINVKLNTDYTVNTRNIMGVFAETSRPAIAIPLALMAEGGVPSIPLHYQVLSLVRALEFLFPDKDKREERLERYQADFASIGASKRAFRNALPELRTRCAHGVSRGGALPLTGLGFNEEKLRAVLGLLRRVATDAVREIHSINIQLNVQRRGN